MFFNRDLKAESATLAKWLISIPSISGTRGEGIIMQAIYDGLAGFHYFKEHPQHLQLVGHQDQQNFSIAALVKAPEGVHDTIVLCAHVDTGTLENYGLVKDLAFKSDELKAELSKHALLPPLDDGSIMPGLGVLQCKGGCACMIAALKELSDHFAALELNVLFLCMSRSLCRGEGIHNLLPFIQEWCRQEALSLYAALQTSPPQPLHPNDESQHLFISNRGLIEPSFFIFGEKDLPGLPFAGFSSALIAGRLLNNLELNPEPLRGLCPQPLTLKFLQHVTPQNSLIHDSCLSLSFSLEFTKLNYLQLLEALKDAAAEAIEQCANLIDERAKLHYYLLERPYRPPLKDAEVLSFSDLKKRAQNNYPGDLALALEVLKQNCRKEGLSAHESICCIIEKLNEFAQLPKPSIVVYLGPRNAALQGLQAARRADRDKLILVHEAIAKTALSFPWELDIQEHAAPSYLNHLRPEGMDALQQLLFEENPLFIPPQSLLNCPGLTLTLKGGNLHQCSEYIDSNMFQQVPTFILSLLNTLAKNSRERKLASPDPVLQAEVIERPTLNLAAADAPLTEPPVQISAAEHK